MQIHSLLKTFLDQVRKSATEQGVSKATLDKAFLGLVEPKPEIIDSENLKLSLLKIFGVMSTKESARPGSIMAMIH